MTDAAIVSEYRRRIHGRSPDSAGAVCHEIAEACDLDLERVRGTVSAYLAGGVG